MTWRNLEHPIDDQERDVMWGIVGRPITSEISTVDLHLIDGDTWQNRVHRIAFNLSRPSQGVITVEIKSWKTHLMCLIAIQQRAFFMLVKTHAMWLHLRHPIMI